MRAAHGVAAGVAELALGGRVGGTGGDASAVASSGIDNRDEGVGIEPLPRSCNGNAGDRGFLIERLPGNAAGILRAVGLKDAVAVGRVRLAEDGEWEAGVQEGRLRK